MFVSVPGRSKLALCSDVSVGNGCELSNEILFREAVVGLKDRRKIMKVCWGHLDEPGGSWNSTIKAEHSLTPDTI